MLLNQIVAHGSYLPDKIALELISSAGTERVTYETLERYVQQSMCFLLAQGVRPGDRVALQLPKCLPFVYLHLATMRLNAISLPLNPGYPPPELSYFLHDAQPVLFFGDHQNKPILQPILADCPFLVDSFWLDGRTPSFLNLIKTDKAIPLPDLPQNPDDTALIFYSSGTTGRPKGAQLTHGNLTANTAGLHTAWGWQEEDVLLHVLPVYHGHGLGVALLSALYAGATTIMMAKFEPQQTLTLLVERRCTVFMAVPTIHKRLVEFPTAAEFDLSHMRLLTSGSDRLPDEINIKFQTLFGHQLLERYGMSETMMNLSNPLNGERRVGSVGLPLPQVEVRIVDVETEQPLSDDQIGEVQVRGPHVFKGYWNRPEQTAASFTADGWLRTGDLGLREADGYYTLKGRSKDLIISGGMNVYPPEVEFILATHPAVFTSAVIGCPDEEWGERVTAVIVLRAGERVTAQEITTFCREQLAAYKIPRQVLFHEQLPRNSIGKVQKSRLRELVCPASR